MNIVPLLLALLTIAPFVHTSEAYSLTKADFASGTWTEAVQLATAYTEKAIRIELYYETLRSNGTGIELFVGLDKKAKAVSSTDILLAFCIGFDGSKITKAELYFKEISSSGKIASISSPEEVPLSLVITIQDGKLECKQLKIKVVI